MRDFFSACGYPIDSLEVAWSRVSKVSRAESLLPTADRTSSDRTKLIIMYHPQNVVAQKIIFQNLDILKVDHKACRVFNEPPVVVFRRAKNMRDLLVRSRVNTKNHLGIRVCNRPSADSIASGDADQNLYPIEFLSNQNPTGLPLHHLKLKVNTTVMLLRNLNPSKELLNGIRLLIKTLGRRVIQAKIMTVANSKGSCVKRKE
ncbi:hypothetical protein RRG08_032883 [Elysia crispata]|uniref:DNA helicase Pif1-like 2B domain-containing protein n=1 Tax=Elysia crispata TaxID=231223 RepID=A0AAE1CKZ1_9GAST|nr:hypothetical protein RRG08_032883 [Elysia crispata]